MPTPEEIAWAAGFFEGEGSTILTGSKAKGYTNLGVVIVQCNKEPLDRLDRIYSGHCNLVHLSRKHEKWNDAWRWWLSGARAKEFINLIYPLLSTKRRFQIIEKFVRCHAKPRKLDVDESRSREAARHRAYKRLQGHSQWYVTKGGYTRSYSYKPKSVRFATCHPGKKHCAHGLCQLCYDRQKPSRQPHAHI